MLLKRVLSLFILLSLAASFVACEFGSGEQASNVESSVLEASVIESSIVETTEVETTEVETTEVETTESETTEIETTEVETTEVETTEVETTESETTEVETTEVETTEVETTEVETTEVETTEVETTEVETTEVETTEIESTEAETTEDESGDVGFDEIEDTSNSDGHKCNFKIYGYVPPTCWAGGYNLLRCEKCGDTKDEPSGEKAFGHSFGGWSIVREATCAEVGNRKRECKTCFEIEYQNIEKLAHFWDDGKITESSSAGCSAVEKMFTCKNCGEIKRENLGGNHTYGEVKYREWTRIHNIGYGDFEGIFREKYQQCTGCESKKILVAEHWCEDGVWWPEHQITAVEGTCTSPAILRTTCPDCGYYWEWEGDYALCNDDKFIFSGKLTDYTEWTNEIYADVRQCTACGKIFDLYTYGYADEGTIDDMGRTDKWKCKYSFGLDIEDAYVPGRILDETGFYEKNVQYQTVIRNIKYDAQGYVTQMEYRWHDKDGNRYSKVVVVDDIPQILVETGLDISKYDLTRVHISLKVRNGDFTGYRVSWGG